MVSGWGVHACFLDANCREYGAGSRLTLLTPWGALILAARRRDWSQTWLPVLGFKHDCFWPVAWHPNAKRARK